jgi:hypothetical protein
MLLTSASPLDLLLSICLLFSIFSEKLKSVVLPDNSKSGKNRRIKPGMAAG